MKTKLVYLLTGILYCFSAKGQLNDLAPLKLRVGVYNVGHFNQGRLGGYQDNGIHAKAQMQNWKEWIGKQGMDIFGLVEWNHYFDRDSTMLANDELLYPFYTNVYFGDRNRWIYNGIATNYHLDNIRQKRWFGEYYALLADLKVGKKVITIISTHIPWQKDWHVPALDSLMLELKKYEYVICMGDINALDNEQLRFQKEGFNIANGGHLGWFGTAAGNNRANGRREGPDTNIDNIITSKNIKIMNVSAPYTGLNDLDHLPIFADLTITWSQTSL